jgi:RimJ/RimL family protein N-acetyltransferase
VDFQERGALSPLAYVPFTAETARLELEVLTPEHAPRLIAGLADPSLYAWLDWTTPDLESLTRRFENICRRPAPDGQVWLNWAVRRRDDGRYAGLAEATVYPNREANLAYFVFTSEQRQGFAVEATAAVIAHLRRDYGVHTFLIAADIRNVASHRVAERLGLERVGGPEPAGTLRGEPAFDYRYVLSDSR